MIQKIAVIGAGTMGHSIALNFAIYGLNVNIYDPDWKSVEKAKDEIQRQLDLLQEVGNIDIQNKINTLKSIQFYTSLKETVADREFVVEAVPENLELKQDLFKNLDDYCPPKTILASNTSSLDLESMMAKVSEIRKKRILITHWYNPAHIMPLVEISNFGNIHKDVYEDVKSLHMSIGKQCIEVLKNIPGLVANRIQQSVAREVFSLMEQQAASPEDIEKALMFGPAFRYATTGQLMIADMGGLDIWCTVGDNLLKDMENRQFSSPLLREKTSEGKLGLKSGEGFFKYRKVEEEEIKKQFNRKLLHQLNASQYYMNHIK
ncbi:3-hydroxyacyl-CoA dehydrogenase NAD-binding domain-containing protein [Cytobacillus firmus]|nr:3-hydroxyacyl-CoA dehydrogenase NAD-binding domain-containing protein [Cytobacillus firmus]